MAQQFTRIAAAANPVRSLRRGRGTPGISIDSFSFDADAKVLPAITPRHFMAHPIFVLEPGTRPLGLEGLEARPVQVLLLLEREGRAVVGPPWLRGGSAYRNDGPFAELRRMLGD